MENENYSLKENNIADETGLMALFSEKRKKNACCGRWTFSIWHGGGKWVSDCVCMWKHGRYTILLTQYASGCTRSFTLLQITHVTALKSSAEYSAQIPVEISWIDLVYLWYLSLS